MSNNWCTIESDPAVFSEMVSKIGVKGVTVEELFSPDVDSIKALEPVYGLILLFKWKPQKLERMVVEDSDLYFAQQVVHNACATQAIINILMNNTDRVDLGEDLKKFHEFTAPLDAKTRGDQIGQSDLLRTTHNSFARNSFLSFEEMQKQAKDDDDVYHFVSYIYKNDIVWELDGLQKAPIFIEPAEEDGWQEVAASALQSRMQEIAALDKTGQGQGISFALMAVVGDKLPKIEAELKAAKEANDDSKAAQLEAERADIVAKREKGALENVRRRHNYIPTVVALLRAMAEKGQLKAALDEAKGKAKDRADAKKEAKK